MCKLAKEDARERSDQKEFIVLVANLLFEVQRSKGFFISNNIESIIYLIRFVNLK